MLDARLQAAAGLVRPGSVVADIGADHGYLVCQLVGDGRCPKGYACDIRPLPLQSSQRTIAALGLQDRVSPLLSDGLQKVPPSVDDVVIAGMGGDLIWKIISAAPWLHNVDKHLVLQPMTKAPELRELLHQNGFAIQREVAAQEGRFLYTILSVQYTGVCQQVPPLFALTGKMWNNRDPQSLQYLHRVSSALLRKADGLAKSRLRAQEAEQWRQLAEKIHRKATQNE